MPIEQVGLGAGDIGGQPLAVGGRYETVLAALPDRDRGRDRVEIEAPVAEQRQVVVEPTPDPRSQRVPDSDGDEPGVLAREHRRVGRRDEIAERLSHLLAGDRPETPARNLR